MTQEQDRLGRRFVKLAGKGLTAYEQLAHAPYADKLDYAFSIHVEPSHWEVAHNLGMVRLLLKQCIGRAPWESRGADDIRVDTEGALAEVLIGLALGTHPKAHFAPLLDHRPVRAADLDLNGKSLDVKSVGQGRRLVNVNCDQHCAKGVHGLVIVHFVRADVADVFVVSASAVNGWQQVKKLRGMDLDPRRWHYRAEVPNILEPLEPADVS